MMALRQKEVAKTKGLFSVILAGDSSKTPVELKKLTKMRYF